MILNAMRTSYFLIMISIILLFSGCLQNSTDTNELRIKIIGKERYDTIQNAINHASDGDTILLSKGIYYEHIQVNKSITLIGNHKDYTILDGNNSGTVCLISSDDVCIMNLSFRNSGSNENEAGLIIQANNSRIKNCSFYQNYHGLAISHDYNTRNNIISNNSFSSNQYGIVVKESNRNHLTDNKIMNNSGYGIFQIIMDIEICEFGSE